MTFHSFLSLVPLERTLNSFVIKRLNTRGVWGVFLTLEEKLILLLEGILEFVLQLVSRESFEVFFIVSRLS